MIRRPPRSTRTDTPFPYTTLCRSLRDYADENGGEDEQHRQLREPPVQLEPVGLGCRDVVRVVLGRTGSGAEDVRPRDDGEDHQSEGESGDERSEEHTSELQSLMRISYAVFCLKKKIETHLHD